MTSSSNEGRHLRFPIFALCWSDPTRPGDDLLLDGEVEGRKCILFYHNKELAELAVEQANRKDQESPHHLLPIDSKEYLIEILKAVPAGPEGVDHIVWDKQLEAAGTFDCQIINCFLGWLLRRKSPNE